MAAFELQQLHSREIERMRALIAQLLQQVEFLRQQKDQSQVLQSHVLQLREANENLVLATFGAQDMQAGAEASMQRQTEFLSMLAHELRNPLQPIVSANELLGKLLDSHSSLPRLHAIIGRQINHLARLVDDLLDASRVSSGKIGLDKSMLLLADVVAMAVESSQGMFDSRQQRLSVELPQGDIHLRGDLVRLVQVFSNLLNNAAKFSPENETVTLIAHVQDQWVRIAVRDQGIGITAALQPFIFDMFTQGMQSKDRAQGGLGIGLTLVRALVELHGGTVTVSSEGIGLGSEFTVTLPLCPPPLVDKAPVAVAAPGRRRKILLVEDNLDANETLSLLLNQAGHQVTQRFDGITAVACALNQRHDLLICDIGLPGLDGFSVVERILAEHSGTAPYFIATSGYNLAADRERAIESGFKHYLVKPVAIDMLLTLIERHVA
ncbi:hybrid sensor histidine kinase/response regulator [Rugamonas sp. CCM 8940]|nr:hybrid sensor histidine kinase/response regulator [Rugamonas sp. CCM 8940]